MRRFAAVLIGVMVVALVGSGCVTPPPAGGSGPYACSSGAVDLGAGNRVEAVSADGQVIVVQVGTADSGMTYDVIDRRSGQRRTVKATGPLGDGAAIFMDAAGILIYGYQYPLLEPGMVPWFEHDVLTRATTSFVPGIDSSVVPGSFSSDLRQFVDQKPSTPGSAPVMWDLVEFPSGSRSPLGVSTESAWRTAGFSPDLSLVVQYSAPASFSKSVRILNTATGTVALDLGNLVNENSSYVDTRFIDDRTLLVNDAVPFGSPPDGISTDGAFVVDVPTGNITRLDPGVDGARTTYATPDGSRSVFEIIREAGTWVRVGGANRKLVDGFGAGVSADISVVVTPDNGRVTLHCV